MPLECAPELAFFIQSPEIVGSRSHFVAEDARDVGPHVPYEPCAEDDDVGWNFRAVAEREARSGVMCWKGVGFHLDLYYSPRRGRARVRNQSKAC